MTRVSTAEMYDDKDVITQICKLKDGLNGALGGIITEMTVDGNDLVVEFADGTSIELPLPNPTGISSIAGSVSGGNLTMTIYMTDGSSHAFTCPLNGMASEAYVDAGLATKADASDVYTKAEVDTALSNKADKKKVRTFDNITDALAALSAVEDYATIALNFTLSNGDLMVDGIYTKYPGIGQLIGACIRAVINGSTYRVCNNVYLTASSMEVRGLDTLSSFVSLTLNSSSTFTAFELRIVESYR